MSHLFHSTDWPCVVSHTVVCLSNSIHLFHVFVLILIGYSVWVTLAHFGLLYCSTDRVNVIIASMCLLDGLLYMFALFQWNTDIEVSFGSFGLFEYSTDRVYEIVVSGCLLEQISLFFSIWA